MANSDTHKTKNKGGVKEERDLVLVETHKKFMEWSVMTKEEREQAGLRADQKAFAQKHKINENTISDWKNRSDYPESRIQAFRDKLSKRTPEVMEALLRRIKKYGMGYEVELYLAFVENWDKKTVLEHRDKLQFGEGDIRELLKHIPSEKRKEFYVTLTKLITEAEKNQSEGKVFADVEKQPGEAQ